MMKTFDTETFFYHNYNFDGDYEEVITKLAELVDELITENNDLRQEVENIKETYENHWHEDNHVRSYD